MKSSKDVRYSVYPSNFTSHTENNDLTVYTFVVDLSVTNLIKFIITDVSNHAHLRVEKILVNDTEIIHMDSISYLRTQSGEIRKTYGYIDEVGEFVIKIHTNAVSLNYLTYLLSLTK